MIDVLKLPTVGPAELKHLPGDAGWPLVGNTFRALADPEGTVKRSAARYGPVYWTRTFGFYNVALLGPEANELVLFDRDRLFSSHGGWGPVLDRLFPRGLMLMDFDEHRDHRKIMSVAFKTGPMQSYIGGLNDGIRHWLKGAADQPTARFYQGLKALTLELAAPCFLGLPLGPEASRINRAFVDSVSASVAPIRKPIWGTAMYRGVKGRDYLCGYFAKEIPKRRGSAATDMFTQMVNATDEAGNHLPDEDIINHINFLMLAAHDTITSSVTSLVWLLGKNPEWQDKLAEEIHGLGLGAGDLPYERLGDLPLTEMAFKEALRINPPVPAIPRRAVRDFTFKGHHIPAGAGIGINPLYVHRDPAIWPDPLRFDPLRFTDANSRGRHKYAWVPFSGGAHMCLGLHFAYMQAKTFFFHLLRNHRIVLEPGAGEDWKMWPIPQPRDGLPLRIVSRP